jgi:hypothetical protein
VVDFINQANLDELPDKASFIESFFSYARAEQQREAGELMRIVSRVNPQRLSPFQRLEVAQH